jgi:SNF2 family DNA or RNA helicase
MKGLWPAFRYKPHQVAGIQWMKNLEATATGGLLCDEMGLGKTIQMLGLMKNTAVKNSLLLAPLPVLQQWRDAATRSGFNCHSFQGRWQIPTNMFLNAPNLYIINYEAAIRNPQALKELGCERIICDEAHKLCSKGAGWRTVHALHAKKVWLLTATPVVNRLGDIRALFELISQEFTEKAAGNFILCRTMNEMREHIPTLPSEAVECNHLLDFDTEDEAEFYRGIQGMIVKRWASAAEDSMNAFDKLKLIMRLRQISLHPQIYIDARKKSLGTAYKRENWTQPSTKFNGINKIISEEPKPQKWIIFCHFHAEMDLLEHSLRSVSDLGKIWKYSGAVDASGRTEILKDTLEARVDQHHVLLCQLQSGGVGLNLQHFSRIIFTGPWWTSALMEQAVGRAVRIGQTSQVIVHHLLLKEEDGLNIDRSMKMAAQAKGAICRAVLDAANHSIA